MLQRTCTILLYKTRNIVLLVSLNIVLREGAGGGAFLLRQDRNPWHVGKPHKYFNDSSLLLTYIFLGGQT